jgi:hypothetical protein
LYPDDRLYVLSFLGDVMKERRSAAGDKTI